MVSEIGCQVDTHIVDGFIDPKYQWNEWELRRNALMLVNLKRRELMGHKRSRATSRETMKPSTTDLNLKKHKLTKKMVQMCLEE